MDANLEIGGISNRKPRKAHRKSRQGCFQCKQRRIKCNEQRPSCYNCTRHELCCRFPSPVTARPNPINRPNHLEPTEIHEHVGFTGNRPLNAATAEGQSSTAQSLQHTAYLNLESHTGLADAELMYHYTLFTSVTLGDNYIESSLNQLWQYQVPKLAFQHEYLLHGILSVAALHLAHITPTRRTELYFKGSLHEQEALKSFQKALVVMDQSNCCALFTFSCLLVPIIFVSKIRESNMSESLAELFDWIGLCQGGYSILRQYRVELENSFLEPLLRPVFSTDMGSIDEIEGGEHMLSLLKFASTIEDEETSQICSLAAHDLVSVFVQANTRKRLGKTTFVTTMTWAIRLSIKFVNLLKEGNPESLVIMAHYCILLHRRPESSSWFLQGYAQYIINVIQLSLSENWHPLIAWPMEVIS
jgi:hypothetical protein